MSENEALEKDTDSSTETHKSSSPRRGSTLEGRVRALLQSRGYNASTNRIILDHEIDVWGEDRDGRIAIAECKEYYDSGPVSTGQVRNFFGKVYDIEHNYGENIYLRMLVSISGFTEAAHSLCERLGILAIDGDALDILEKSNEEIVPRYSTLEDQAIIELRKKRDKLREEMNRRNLVRKLGQQIEDYTRSIQTRTLPSFLVPSALSKSFWYSTATEIPFVGLNGEFRDFLVPAFPLIKYMVYHQRRFLGKREMTLPLEEVVMEHGAIHLGPDALNTAQKVPPEDANPRLHQLLGTRVITLDKVELGTVLDFSISFRKEWVVDCVKVTSNSEFRSQLNQPDFGIPADRISLKETEDGWSIIAHVRLATEIAAGLEL